MFNIQFSCIKKSPLFREGERDIQGYIAMLFTKRFNSIKNSLMKSSTRESNHKCVQLRNQHTYQS